MKITTKAELAEALALKPSITSEAVLNALLCDAADWDSTDRNCVIAAAIRTFIVIGKDTLSGNQARTLTDAVEVQ